MLPAGTYTLTTEDETHGVPDYADAGYGTNHKETHVLKLIAEPATDGGQTIHVTFISVTGWVSILAGHDLPYDSRTGKDSHSKMLRDTMGTQFDAFLKPDGSVDHFAGLQVVWDKIAADPAVKDIYAADGSRRAEQQLTTLLTLVRPPMHAQPVKPGETWTPDAKGLQDRKGVLERITLDHGQSIAHVRMAGSMKAANNPAVSGEAAWTIELDLNSGRMVREEDMMKMTVRVPDDKPVVITHVQRAELKAE